MATRQHSRIVKRSQLPRVDIQWLLQRACRRKAQDLGATTVKAIVDTAANLLSLSNVGHFDVENEVRPTRSQDSSFDSGWSDGDGGEEVYGEVRRSVAVTILMIAQEIGQTSGACINE